MSDKNKKWAIKMQCRYFCPFCPFCQFAENFINPQKATLLSRGKCEHCTIFVNMLNFAKTTEETERTEKTGN